MDRQTAERLVRHLAGFVSARRRACMERVLAHRTRHLTVVLEDLYQSHNASAVLRTCDCFGVQDVHVVESQNEYLINPQVDVGASGWLTLHRHADMASCAAQLRACAYRIVAATPHGRAVSLAQLPIAGPVAILLGTEEQGLSRDAMDVADGFVTVPMCGFTRSLNVSVCAALIVRELTGRVRGGPDGWQLSEEEKQDLRLRWYRGSVRRADLIEARFLADRSPG